MNPTRPIGHQELAAWNQAEKKGAATKSTTHLEWFNDDGQITTLTSNLQLIKNGLQAHNNFQSNVASQIINVKHYIIFGMLFECAVQIESFEYAFQI